MQNLNIFKIVSMGLAFVIGIVALLIFSGKFPGIESTAKSNENKPTLTVWGTVDRAYIDKAILNTTQNTGKPFQFNYVQFSKDTISEKMIQAGASGQAPDMILAENDVINNISGLLYVLPYSYMDELTYKNMFIDASHIYATPFGAQMYPVLVDPLITFYNKKIFRENGLTNPPENWLELPKYQDKLTVRDTGDVPVQSAFGLGANNIVNNKNILVANLMQLGHNPAQIFYSLGDKNSLQQNFANDLGTSATDGGVEGDIYKILRFQTAFSDPQKTVYTWSEIDVTDYEKFVSGRSAIYFGKASDYYKTLSESPNLELGINYLPQLSNKYNVTTGDIIGVGVSNTTKDFPYSVEMAKKISGDVFGPTLASLLGVSSARKDILAGADGTARSSVIGGSAIIMQIYYDINFASVNSLFFTLYENILSGKRSVDKAVEIFERSFVSLYKR